MIATKTIYEAPKPGPCIKVKVTATLIAPSGMRYVGTNDVQAPQATCPRGNSPRFTNYGPCKTVCKQESHAEVSAILLAGDDALGSTIYLEGHVAACPSCRAAANAAGVAQIVVSAPPAEAVCA